MTQGTIAECQNMYSPIRLPSSVRTRAQIETHRPYTLFPKGVQLYGNTYCMENKMGGVYLPFLAACDVHQEYLKKRRFEAVGLAILILRLLMSYIYGAPNKARNANVVYIWTYVWQR